MLYLHFLVVLDHRFFPNTKTSKMRGKVGTNATGDSMGLKENVQEPGETNVNENHV